MRSAVDTKTRDWYSVSVDTLRAWGIVLALGVMVAVGFFGYRYWERYDLERRASEAVGEARQLSSRLRSAELPDSFRDDYRRADFHLRQATGHLYQEEFVAALERGRESRDLYQSILAATGRARGKFLAEIVSVDGNVEYRRGDGGPWEGARPRTQLYSGDYFKTGANGSAELVFDDGTHYVVRPGTQFVLTHTRDEDGSTEQSIQMEHGWVNLNTRDRAGTIATPEAEARIEKESEATVAYDSESGRGKFAALRGGMEVESTSGATRRMEALQEVTQQGGLLSEPLPLPPPPALDGPEDNLDVDADRDSQVVLAWQPVDGAESYALQVSASPLFVDNVIDVDGRRKTLATLGVRGEGVFHWRVAATGTGGGQGPWSATRRFRVTVPRSTDPDRELEPPPLTVDEIKPYGSIFHVKGRTEPGISLSINGEPVRVEANGEFGRMVQFTSDGWSFIEVRARDGRGAEAVVTRRVHVDIL